MKKKSKKAKAKDTSCPVNCGHDDPSWCTTREDPKPDGIRSSLKNSSLKNSWVEVQKKDMCAWLGEYIVSKMMLQAYSKKRGFPTSIGNIQDMVKQKDGSGLIKFEARWD